MRSHLFKVFTSGLLSHTAPLSTSLTSGYLQDHHYRRSWSFHEMDLRQSLYEWHISHGRFRRFPSEENPKSARTEMRLNFWTHGVNCSYVNKEQSSSDGWIWTEQLVCVMSVSHYSGIL